jgi:hypothetical protein
MVKDYLLPMAVAWALVATYFFAQVMGDSLEHGRRMHELGVKTGYAMARTEQFKTLIRQMDEEECLAEGCI